MEEVVEMEKLELLVSVGLLSMLSISEDGSRIEATVMLLEWFDAFAFKELVEVLMGRQYEIKGLRYNGGGFTITLEEVGGDRNGKADLG